MPDSLTLVTGGSGFLGSHLIPLLRKENLNPAVLGRKKVTSVPSFTWDLAQHTIENAALENTGSIVHLAGAGIADKPWTKSYKQLILSSRKDTANLLFDYLKRGNHQVKTLVSASAVGFYGDTGDAWVNEDTPGQDGFLGETCRLWEESALRFKELGIRVVILRIGLVLAGDGGALPVLAKPVRWFAGAALGSGRQYMPWIHVDDLCRIFVQALTGKSVSGIYNAAAPAPVTNLQFMKEVAGVLHRPLWPFRVPSFVLRTMLGERAAIVLNGQRVSSEKILQTGFRFKHTELKETLAGLL
jgi:uncharacterized protein (TIGR01777 family)